MTEGAKKDCPEKECPFFDICGAAAIREYCRPDTRGKWYKEFCFADFQNCVHYQDRKKP